MTVQIHTKGFLSEAAAQKNPFTYVWFQIVKGKVLLDAVSKDLDVELSKGEKFGLKITKAGIYLLDEDNMFVQFKIKPEDMQALLKNAKGYSGKINGVDVRAGDPVQPPGSLNKEKLKNLDSDFRAAMLDYIRGNKTNDKKRAREARKTLFDVAAVLNAQGVKLPAGYNKHPMPPQLGTAARSRRGAGTTKPSTGEKPRRLDSPQSKRTERHPGLDVKQGAVPKQDKASEAVKRITERTSTNALKRLGVTINRSSKTGIIGTAFVDARDVPRIKSTFESAGWKAAIRNDGSNRVDGSGPRFKVLYLTLTGAKRYITIDMSGNSKGNLKIRHSK